MLHSSKLIEDRWLGGANLASWPEARQGSLVPRLCNLQRCVVSINVIEMAYVLLRDAVKSGTAVSVIRTIMMADLVDRVSHFIFTDSDTRSNAVISCIVTPFDLTDVRRGRIGFFGHSVHF